MAVPRVFISSTFYDLKHVRADLERCIRELGYEPVRNETGAIPYYGGERLETAAYREVESCDILVSIIGGRFGTESSDYPRYSITQNELKRAVERGVQVFIFIEAQVLAEYRTYQANRDKEVKWVSVDDKRVFEFIEEIFNLPRNNALSSFNSSDEIAGYLKIQWAGLFQRFLSEQFLQSQLRTVDQMSAVAKTLQDLVGFLTEERKNRDAAIQKILMVNHPLFRKLKALTGTPYRVFFETQDEMELWLRARSWERASTDRWDTDSVDQWIQKDGTGYIKFTERMFDGNGQLLLFTEDTWDDKWVTYVKYPVVQEEDDIPF